MLKRQIRRALLAFLLISSSTAQVVPESTSPTMRVPAGVVLRNGAEWSSGHAQAELQLPGDAYAEWQPQVPLSTKGGSLSMWIRPLWAPDDDRSHTFATFAWSGADAGYFSLSQGWWEPEGQGKLYIVLSNQQYVFCLTPWSFKYTLFLPQQWTQLGVTWRAGAAGYVRLYVDGRRICERHLNFLGDRMAGTPIYLGSDRGAAVEQRHRSAQMAVKELGASEIPISDAEMRSMYRLAGGSDRPKWISALLPGADPAGGVGERRVMQDEDTRWASSKSEIRRRVARVKAAGFNVYMPNVWDGSHAYYMATNAPVARSVHDSLDTRYDPLQYLIEIAHAEGIAVHPWFIIARNPGGSDFPLSYTIGAPDYAFNLQSSEFRSFIVALVGDVARRYDVDGINLDYLRAMGPCSDRGCLDRYSAKYHRSLQDDWATQVSGKDVPSLIEWNREVTTDIVRRVSVAVRSAKPHILLTIDTIPFEHGRAHQGVDDEGWLRAGLIDGLMYMAYDDPLDIATIDRSMKAFTPERQTVVVRNYDVFGEDGWENRSGGVMADYVRLIRARWPGAGIGFYQYPHLSQEQIQGLGTTVFKAQAAHDWSR